MSRKATPVLNRVADGVPAGYGALLQDLKARIRVGQVKSALAVNRELIELYWYIGRAIVRRQQKQRWGQSVVERLALDLQRAFPDVSGFSRQNIWKMRAFHLAWTVDVQNLSQPVRELDGTNLPQAVREIPWGHNIELISKLKDPLDRLWYAQRTVTHGWSRAVLEHQIDTRLHLRSGKAIHNFARTLPPADSDLAGQLLKDPYHFHFLTLAEHAKEKHLEQGLLAHVRQFLLELGAGFAFVGQQFPIEVDGVPFRLDLLFYHLRLRRYVVIDLKVEEFKPEFTGKMNFYLTAVDEQLRHQDDGPSVGLILCKSHRKLIAEYALRDIGKPMGVSTYAAQLPAPLRKLLPSPAQLSQEMQKATVANRAVKRRHE